MPGNAITSDMQKQRRLAPMSREKLLAGVLALAVATGVACAEPPPRVDVPGWKVYRNETMGFELRYPNTWRVRLVKATGAESVMLSETPQAGKAPLAVQLWVQRNINPHGLPIRQWYADQLRKMHAAPPPAASTSIGGRPAVRMDAALGSTRQFQFFASLNKTDVFEITVGQPSSQAHLDQTYGKLISTLKFIH